MKKLVLLSTLLFSSVSFAFDNPYLSRSPRGLLMGDAFTAVNDDEYTLFYNPASLARHKNDFTLYPFNPQFSGTNIIDDMDKFEDIPEDPVGVSELLMDYPAHASASIAPGFKFYNVGVTFLATESFDAHMRNQAHPMLDLDLRSDKGVLMGVGIPLGPRRLSSKNASGSQTSIGFGAKYIERTGVEDSLALTGNTFTSAMGEEELEDLVKGLGRVKGIGWGFDAGFEHVIRNGNGQMIMGLSAMDITGTEYKVDKNPDNLKVADTRNQINLGLAGGHDFKVFHYILSADVRALNEEMDFGKRLRIGAEIGVPGLKLLGGVNSGYYSYGAMLDLALLKVTAGFYDVEIGSKYKQTKSRRFVLYLSLFDFSFDA